MVDVQPTVPSSKRGWLLNPPSNAPVTGANALGFLSTTGDVNDQKFRICLNLPQI